LETKTAYIVTTTAPARPKPRVHRCPWGCGAVIGSSVQVQGVTGRATWAMIGAGVATDYFAGWCAGCKRRIRWLGNKRVVVIVENGIPLDSD
jgi:hypothetical protein